MHGKLILLPTVFCCFLVSSCSRNEQQKQSAAERSTAAVKRLKDFELTTSTGRRLFSQDLKGQIWLASYFFTQCGANCRLMNMKLAELAKEYGPRGVHFVSLTCDPRNDTPEALASYAQIFNADQRFWTFTTGELGYLQQIGTDVFEISVSERAHHARITIMDRQSAARGTFDVLDPTDLARAIQLLDQLLASGTGQSHAQE